MHPLSYQARSPRIIPVLNVDTFPSYILHKVKFILEGHFELKINSRSYILTKTPHKSPAPNWLLYAPYVRALRAEAHAIQQKEQQKRTKLEQQEQQKRQSKLFIYNERDKEKSNIFFFARIT